MIQLADNPVLRPGMRIEYVKPGKLMSRKKANALIGLANAVMNMQVVNGQRNGFAFTEQNAILTIGDAFFTGPTSSGGQLSFQTWDITATYSTDDVVLATSDVNSAAPLPQIDRNDFFLWIDTVSGNTADQPSFYDCDTNGVTTTGQWQLLSTFTIGNANTGLPPVTSDIVIAGSTFKFRDGILMQVV